MNCGEEDGVNLDLLEVTCGGLGESEANTKRQESKREGRGGRGEGRKKAREYENMESRINLSLEPLHPAVVEAGYLGIFRHMSQ